MRTRALTRQETASKIFNTAKHALVKTAIYDIMKAHEELNSKINRNPSNESERALSVFRKRNAVYHFKNALAYYENAVSMYDAALEYEPTDKLKSLILRKRNGLDSNCRYVEKQIKTQKTLLEDVQ